MQPFNRDTSKYRAEFIFHERFPNGPDPRPNAFTFAVVFTKDGIVGTGIARCSESDQFCRKIGTAIARGRARRNTTEPITGVVYSDDKKVLFEKAKALFRLMRIRIASGSGVKTYVTETFDCGGTFL